MKIRVLFFVSTLENVGPTNVIYNIIKYLDRTIIEPMVLTMSPEPAKTRKRDFELLGVPIVSVNQNRVSWFLSGGKKLKDQIDKINPDIIHSHSLRPDVFASKVVGIRRMATLHADLESNYSNTFNAFVGKYLARKHLDAVKHFESIVAVSNSVFALYRDRIPTITCIPNGVDDEIFKPLAKNEITNARLKLNLPIGKTICICVGSLCHRKDPSTVIEGFLRSKSAQTSLLLILGEGVLSNALRKKYGHLANIRFKGFSSDVSEFMAVSDYFISASTSEGLPNTVLEALASGLPVCLSDIGPHREILQNDFGAGRMFPCHDTVALANALDTLISEDVEFCRRKALEIIQLKLNARTMSKSYELAYGAL